MSQDKIFADGFSFKRRENAPEFVIGCMSVKVDTAIEFLKSNQKNGWCNLDVKIARSGNMYVELDTFVPNATKQTPPPKKEVASEQTTEELPF
jgi:hypothetical protein